MFFRAPESILAEFPEYDSADSHDELMQGIEAFLESREPALS